jgi:hypothetical protein
MDLITDNKEFLIECIGGLYRVLDEATNFDDAILQQPVAEYTQAMYTLRDSNFTSLPSISDNMINFLNSKFLDACKLQYDLTNVFNIVCTTDLRAAKWMCAYIIHITPSSISTERLFCTLCEKGHQEAVEWLCTLGVNPRCMNNTAYIAACMGGRLDIVKLLHSKNIANHSIRRTLFFDVCVEGHIDVARWLYATYTSSTQRDIQAAHVRPYDANYYEVYDIYYFDSQYISELKRRFANVSQGTSLEMLQWIYKITGMSKINCPNEHEHLVYVVKDMHIMKWLYEIDYCAHTTLDWLKNHCYLSSLDVIKFLIETYIAKNVQIDYDYIFQCVVYNKECAVDAVKYILQHNQINRNTLIDSIRIHVLNVPLCEFLYTYVETHYPPKWSIFRDDIFRMDEIFEVCHIRETEPINFILKKNSKLLNNRVTLYKQLHERHAHHEIQQYIFEKMTPDEKTQINKELNQSVHMTGLDNSYSTSKLRFGYADDDVFTPDIMPYTCDEEY